MHRGSALTLLGQLKKLHGAEENQLERAKKRVAMAQEELARAEADFASADVRAGAAFEAVQAAERFVANLPEEADQQPEAMPDAAAPAPESAPPGTPGHSIVEQILEFLHGRQETPRQAIIDHFQKLRPGIKAGNVSPELSRLAKAGRIIRVERGVYRLPPEPTGGDA